MGTGLKIVIFHHLILLLSLEGSLLNLALAINAVSLGTGQGTALQINTRMQAKALGEYVICLVIGCSVNSKHFKTMT